MGVLFDEQYSEAACKGICELLSGVDADVAATDDNEIAKGCHFRSWSKLLTSSKKLVSIVTGRG